MLFHRNNRTSLLVCAATFLIWIAGCTTATPPIKRERPSKVPAPAVPPVKTHDTAGVSFIPTTFDALPGWGKDDLRQALPAFLLSCDVLSKQVEWREICTVVKDVDPGSEKSVRLFFESFFVPHQVINADGSTNGLVTGYYEPLLHGARKRGGSYQTPLYRVPDDLLTIDLSSVYPELKSMRLKGRLVGNKVVPYPSRGELAKSSSLSGKELLWVDDPIEAFFLQVQGSGRVQLTDAKETVRIAYADQNGHPYKSIARYLVDKGEMSLEQASAQNIKAWAAANPSRQQELLNTNPSYVFFKEEKLTDSSKGPKGALGVPLTSQRSIAIDAHSVPLGVPVFLATTYPGKNEPLQRLAVAQDTGAAIKGGIRLDYFWGFGSAAGDQAGKMKQRGMIWVLLPKGFKSSAITQ